MIKGKHDQGEAKAQKGNLKVGRLTELKHCKLV